MIRKSITIIVLLVFILALVGCSQRIGDFTLISTKIVHIGEKYQKLPGRFTGEDKRVMLFGIPLGYPNIKEATDKCIEAGKGDLLTNAVIDSHFWTIVIYGEIKYTVTGDVWVKAEMTDLYDSSVNLYELRVSNMGYELVSISNPSEKIKVDYFLSSR